MTKSDIKVLIKADSRYPIDRKKIRRKVAEVLGKKGFTDKIEVSLAFVGDRKMKQLNKQYMDREGTTDVLSFPLAETEVAFPDEGRLRLGDIVISYPQARQQAGEHNVLVDEEINRLVEHGLRHLLGINHG